MHERGNQKKHIVMEDKYNFQETEQALKEQWLTKKVYNFDAHKQPRFSIDTPPPTVSGALHIGHIFSYTQADILARFARMNGAQVFYPFGFDDNGLATERFVEKKRKISPFILGRAVFTQACLEETHEAEKQFKALWQSVGLSVDWNLWYSTISPLVRKLSQESFIRLHNNGHIYRKQAPALYCTTCRTTVAQAELEDKAIDTNFCDLVFTAQNGQALTISTTRPELLPACVALFYHPADERYTILKNQKAIVPLYNYEVPILADELVDPTKGTGLVMCCTFGDKNDIFWFQKHKLPYRQAIQRDGKWSSETGFLAGMNAQQARAEIIQKLTAAGKLINQKPINHSVNVHERCKKEIEYLIVSQWFIKILDHKKEFLDLADQISWYPAYMKSRYINWVENLGWDWCISRQRFFGIPFPVWHCSACGEVVLADIKQLPVDPQETPCPNKCPKCNATEFTPDTDVMDTWNTSSITPYICYALINENTTQSPFETTGSFLPMAMRPQAHDIIRTWAFYTIVKTWFHSKTIPWKTILISGHVLSSAAEKISKSQGNAPIDPAKLIGQWSADAVRFWAACATLGTDTAFSENQLKIGQKTVTKLWNAFKFLHMHTTDIKPEENFKPTNTINQWLLHKTTGTFVAYNQHLEQKEFSLALGKVDKLFWEYFCDNYLELIKPYLFKPEEYPQQEVAEIRQTLYQVGLQLLQLYAPFMPFITEKLYLEIYQSTVQVDSLHQTQFTKLQQDHVYPTAVTVIEKLLELITSMRKLKTAHQLSLGTALNELVIYTNNPELKTIIEKHQALLKGIARTQKITLSTQIVQNIITTQDQDIRMYLNADTP